MKTDIQSRNKNCVGKLDTKLAQSKTKISNLNSKSHVFTALLTIRKKYPSKLDLPYPVHYQIVSLPSEVVEQRVLKRGPNNSPFL